MSNSLDPDQARQNVGPDLGPTCFKGYKQAILTSKELKCLSVGKLEDLLYFNISGDHSHLLHSNVSTGKTRSRINEMLGHSVVSNMALNHTTMSTVPHKKVKLNS